MDSTLLSGAGATSLVLPGGGARGAYQVGVLKAIGEFCGTRNNPFPIVIGTSVGAINAAAVASYAGHYRERIPRLEALWQALHADNIYRTDFLPLLRSALRWLAALTVGGRLVGNPVSLLDTAPLRGLLERSVDFAGIRQAIDQGFLQALAVSASGYSNGRVVTFFQGQGDLDAWQRQRRDGVKTTIATTHLMASVALPFLFPAQRVGDQYYGDGSLRLTAPLSPAIRLGADRVLVIGVRDRVPDIEHDHPTHPSIGDLAGYMLDIAFNDNLDNDIERLCRINSTLALMEPDARSRADLRHIEIMTVSPSKDIRTIAGRHADTLPWTIKALLKSVGAWRKNWRMLSYLLFEPQFVRELIELGYQDAMADQAALRAFLTS